MSQNANRISDLRIRDAGPSDQESIRIVTLKAYQEYAPQVSTLLWEGYRQNILDTLAEVTPAEQIVAEQNGTILGTVLLYPAGLTFQRSDGAPTPRSELPEVRLLAVAPSQRGQGIGAALMDECVRRARASGAAALTLHTTDIMQAAMGLYERMGFVRAPELDFKPAPELTIKGFRLSL